MKEADWPRPAYCAVSAHVKEHQIVKISKPSITASLMVEYSVVEYYTLNENDLK